ncbi:MAG: hypothetical protein A2X42_00190 [Candidatus Margulisbacteria bacterium GWF2_38_17]|nr:MAG: hypothetical protein A2X42_00190 [Candidatus Margulisbacteria bacterium GWF2_38_17]
MNAKQKKLKIAIFPSYGHVLPFIVDCIGKALEEISIAVHYVNYSIINGEYIFTTKTLQDLIDFAPDFAFFLGQNGYLDIEEGGHFLHIHKIPYAVFLFDFPLRPLVLANHRNEYLKALFVWDREYISLFQSLGIKQTHYLPLATLPSYFDQPRSEEQIYQVSFIGAIIDDNSLKAHQNKLPPGLREQADILIKSKTKNNNFNICIPEIITNKNNENYLRDFFGYINARHSSYYRKNLIYHISRNHIVDVFGNKEWLATDNRSIRVHPTINYKKDIFSIYHQSKINLNFSASQLASSINQRVFDCFASNSFLLTDDKSDLDYLFAQDDIRIPSFSSRSDLLDKINYFLTHENERNEISQTIKNVIIKKHTWLHRMEQVLDIIMK